MSSANRSSCEAKALTADQDRVPKSEKLAYAVGAIADNSCGNVVKNMANPVLNMELGMNPILVGLAVAIPRLWDAFTDPLMGVISDRTRTRWGRRRPFILVGGIFSMILMTLIWQIPTGASQGVIFGLFLAMSLLFYTAYTVFGVPYHSLGFELSTDYNERSRVMAWRYFFASFSGILMQWTFWLTQRSVFHDSGRNTSSLWPSLGNLTTTYKKREEFMLTKQMLSILAAITCSAGISQAAVIPYSSDANTLHLWHLDEPGHPLADSAGSLPLYNWGSRGTLGIDSIVDLNTAYETSKTENSNIQDNSYLGLLSWTNELMGADGAFTWEMVLRPDEADGSRVGTQMLMHHSLNQMQLKLNYAGSGDLFLEMTINSVVLFSEQLDSGVLGINQYATNEWFHLAVTYDGTSAGKVYWTKLGDDYTGTANELAAFSMSDLLLDDATLAFGGKAHLQGDVFNGAIDEIRISDIARASDAFLVADFDPPNPTGFASQPTAISSSELWMTATVGSDASGVVEYLFTETSGNPGGASSGWQYSPNFTAVGLSPDTQYSYTVTMRDAFGNTGTVSSPVAATTLATDPSGPELRPSRVFVATSGEHAGKLVRYDAAGNPVLLKAFGVNYHTAFLRYLDYANDTSFIEGFEYLRDHYIPVARVMAAGFWPKDWNLYFTDKTEYFRRMDYFIAQAEQHGIGLILSLFWSVDTLGELVDDAVVAGYLTPGVDFVPPSPLNRDEFGAETYDEYKRAMGRPDSGSNAFIELYTREMVERYKNSPAIWGWELGNEYNLKVDHPMVPNGRVRWGGAAVQGMTLADSNTNLEELPAWTGPDDLVRADVLVAKTNFANTVRSIDPWRLITSGDAKSLRSAYHNMTEHTWTVDSRAEHAQLIPVDNPAPMDTVSVHIYPSKPGEENLNPHIYFTDDPVTNSWVDGQYKELLDYFMAESAALGQALIVGEWGGIGDGTTEDEKTTFHRYMQALMDSGVQLSLLWNFDNTHLNQKDVWWVNPGMAKEYQLTNADPDLWDLEQANLYFMAGYDIWDWNFAQADLSDPTADFDGDGVANLMEYALGGNPTHNDAAVVRPVFQIIENYFVYVHNERTDDPSLSYTVEWTDDLVNAGGVMGWEIDGVEFVDESAFSDVFKTVTNRIPTSGKDQQFIRLKIEQE